MTTPPDPLPRYLEMIEVLNQEQGWKLDEDACRHYASALRSFALERYSDVVLRRIISNYHQDHRVVAALLTEEHPRHAEEWAEVRQRVQITVRHVASAWLTGGVIEVDDVTQLACVEINRSLPSFRFGSRLSTWLHEVTVRNTYRHIRDSKAKKRNGQVVPIDEQGELSLAVGASEQPEAVASSRALLGLINETLAQYPDKRLTTIFMLWAVKDRSAEEIGQLIHLHPSRVRTLLAHIRKLLRENPALQQWNEDD